MLIATQIEGDLAALGYASCDIVDTEAAAVAAASVRCPDLITADDRLVTGSGVAAVQTICQDQAIPVVFIFGALGINTDGVPHAAIIRKPFGITRLRDAVNEAISRAKIVKNQVGHRS